MIMKILDQDLTKVPDPIGSGSPTLPLGKILERRKETGMKFFIIKGTVLPEFWASQTWRM
jgi:hypothetical protein